MHFLSVFTLIFCINLSRGEFQLDVFNLRLAGTRMSSGVVKIIPEVSLIKCAILCAQDPSQIAFNYNAEDRNCELITKNQNVSLTSLEKDDYYNYYIISSFLPCQAKCEGSVCIANSDGISYECRSVVIEMPGNNDNAMQSKNDPCESSPCQMGSECSATPDGMDYQCLNCFYPGVGKNCSAIQSKPDPCESKPCQMGSECSATPDGMNYKCRNCIYPGVGKNCKKFVCGSGDNCFHNTGTFYFLGGSSDQVSWKDTFSACNDLGLEMVTLKAGSNEQYLFSETMSIYTMELGMVRFWLGLTRGSAGAGWNWTDGSPLGQYHPWVSKEPGAKDLYVSFTFSSQGHFIWSGEVNAPYEDVTNGMASSFKYPTFCQAKITMNP